MYQVGQSVEIVSHGMGSNGWSKGGIVTLKRQRTHLESFPGRWEATCVNGNVGFIDEMHFRPAPKGPVRTVTRREIVPGSFGRNMHVGKPENNRVHVSIGGVGMVMQLPLYSADELDAAARTLQQLAEALRAQ